MGQYVLFLPSGTYYLQVGASGYKTLRTNIFSLDSSFPVNMDFTLSPKNYIDLGFFRIPLPDFSINSVELKLANIDLVEGSAGESFIGKQLPEVKFTSPFTGKPTVLTLLNSWDPNASTQIGFLEKSRASGVNSIIIFEQETSSRITIFKRRGGYTVPMLADQDGELIEPLGIQTLPMHLFLDRRGTIKKVMYGILNKEEIENNLIN
jgi:hypothetical protein